MVPGAEIAVHPSDLILRGLENDVNQLQATILDNLDFGSAYLTWTKQANEIEDELRSLCLCADASEPADQQLLEQRLAGINRQIYESGFSVDEWQVLNRQKLKLELLILHRFGQPRQRKAS